MPVLAAICPRLRPWALEQPGVLDLAGAVGQGAAGATVPGFGDRAGVGGAFGGEDSFHLGEQRQEQECDAAHALGGGADRQRVGQRPDADPPGEVVHEDWLAARLDDLDYGDIDGICAAARAYPLVGVKKDEMDKALGYFENNAPRFRYKWFRSRGLFVGSGAVEAGCKSSDSGSSSQACTGPSPAQTRSPRSAASKPAAPKTRPVTQPATRHQPPDQPNPLNDLDHLQDWRTPARTATPTEMSLPSPNITMNWNRARHFYTGFRTLPSGRPSARLSPPPAADDRAAPPGASGA